MISSPKTSGPKPQRGGKSHNQRPNDKGDSPGRDHGRGGNAHKGGKGSSNSSSGNNTPNPQSRQSQSLSPHIRSFLHAIGQKVVVTLKNGEKWQGIFHSSSYLDDSAPTPISKFSEQKKYGIIIRMATKLTNDPSAVFAVPQELFQVPDDDFVSLRYQLPPRPKFQTDTEISSQYKVATERQLVQWNSESHTEDLNFELDHRATSHPLNSWDQFEENAKAGLLNPNATPYNEEFYTTKLDRTSADYKVKAAHAERVAQEIESGMTGDRNVIADDDGLDEEDRYSMVLTAPAVASPSVPARSKGAYVPPSLRDKNQGKAPTGPSSQSTGNQPTGASNKSTTNGQGSSSPLLRSLDLADEAAVPEKKAFQPFSLDPSKSHIPSTTTRTEDTAKLKKSSSEIDEKVRQLGDSGQLRSSGPTSPLAASGERSGSMEAPRKSLRQAADAEAWVSLTDRIFLSSPVGASSPVTAPTLTGFAANIRKDVDTKHIREIYIPLMTGASLQQKVEWERPIHHMAPAFVVQPFPFMSDPRMVHGGGPMVMPYNFPHV